MTGIRERPILFSDEMVRAIRDGRKTQTRRIVTPPPGFCGPYYRPAVAGRQLVFWDASYKPSLPPADGLGWLCPHGGVGDRLWVRECWRPFMAGYSSGVEYRADGVERSIPGRGEEITELIKRRGGNLKFSGAKKEFHSLSWRPSIHMFRWMARIELELTELRVERLQEISELDAQREGIRLRPPHTMSVNGRYVGFEGHPIRDPHNVHRAQFACLWDDINEKRGFGWATNPWVWVLTFDVTKK